MFDIHSPGEPEHSALPRASYPFKRMRVGQFFVVPEVIRHPSAKAAATQYGQRTASRFTCRTNQYGELVVKRIE